MPPRRVRRWSRGVVCLVERVLVSKQQRPPLLRRLCTRVVYVEQADLAGEVRVEGKKSGERRIVGDVEEVLGKLGRKLDGL